eukprot:630999-Prymnesium_polylepis.1
MLVDHVAASPSSFARRLTSHDHSQREFGHAHGQQYEQPEHDGPHARGGTEGAGRGAELAQALGRCGCDRECQPGCPR